MDKVHLLTFPPSRSLEAGTKPCRCHTVSYQVMSLFINVLMYQATRRRRAGLLWGSIGSDWRARKKATRRLAAGSDSHSLDLGKTGKGSLTVENRLPTSACHR